MDMKLIWYILLLNAQVLYISAEYVTVCSDWHHHARIKCPGNSVIQVASVYRYERTSSSTCEVPESSTDSCTLHEDTLIEDNEEEASRSVFYRCHGNRECLIEPEDAIRTLDCGTTDLLRIWYSCHTIEADDIVLSSRVTEEVDPYDAREIFSPNYPCEIPADIEFIHCHADLIPRGSVRHLLVGLIWRLISFQSGDEECGERLQVFGYQSGSLQNTCSSTIVMSSSEVFNLLLDYDSDYGGPIRTLDVYYNKTTGDPGGRFWLRLDIHQIVSDISWILTCDIRRTEPEEMTPRGTQRDTCTPFTFGSTTVPSAVTTTTDQVTSSAPNDIKVSAFQEDSSNDDSSVTGVATGLTVIIVILFVVIGILIWKWRKALHTPPDVETQNTSKLDKEVPLSPIAPNQEYEELDKTTREPTAERDNQGYVNTVAPVYVNVQEESKYEDVETNEDNQRYEPVRQQPR